jgi:hypothetical protein
MAEAIPRNYGQLPAQDLANVELSRHSGDPGATMTTTVIQHVLSRLNDIGINPRISMAYSRHQG